MHRGQHRALHAGGCAGHRFGLQFGERRDARDLLHQIGLALHVRSPCGDRDVIAVAIRHRDKSEIGQDARLLRRRNVHADQRGAARRVEAVGARRVRHGARRDHL